MLREPERRPRRRAPGVRDRGDQGSAMILVLMVLALVTALGSTVAIVTLNNLQGSRRADEAGQVLNAAEAGVAQALTFIRENGVGTLTCAVEGGADCGAWWGSDKPVTSPAGFGGNASYRVWIQQQTKFSPSHQSDGVYVIHSTGLIGTGAHPEAQRDVSAKVQVSSFGVPQGIFARDLNRNGNGTPKLINQSIFTGSCFVHRGQLTVSGDDPYFGIPAGVHTSDVITMGGENACDGGNGNGNTPIHQGVQKCNKDFPYDQDHLGGVFNTASDVKCRTAAAEHPEAYGVQDPTNSADGVYGSYVKDEASLRAAFGFGESPLTVAQIERLREIAQDAGTLTTGTAWPPVTSGSQKVFFFDLTHATGQREVNLDALPAVAEDPCNPPVVVIQNGNAVMHNGGLVASIFMIGGGDSYGSVFLNGGTLQGSLSAETLDLGGNVELTQQSCAVDSIPPQLLNLTVTSYTETD